MIPQVALVDTGYWYALLDERDQYHKDAVSNYDYLQRMHYLIPWPVMYETLCTRFTRQRLSVKKFENILKSPNATTLNDNNYREAALALTLDTTKPHPNTISAVDSVLRLILDDRAIRINFMFTFNHNDFKDICLRRNIKII